jgi:hypothetical protein
MENKLMQKLKYLFLACTLLKLDYSYSQDYLFESDAEIASHKRQASSYTFQRGNNNPNSPVIGYLFKPGENDPYKGIDDKILVYHGLPLCDESKVGLDEVFHHSEGSEAIDFIVYDYRDPKQAKLAASQKRTTIPWDPNYDPSAGHMTVDAKLQDLARVMAPECLPTSFKYIYSGSKRYREAKTGTKAWE